MQPGVCTLGLCSWDRKVGSVFAKRSLKTEISNSVRKTTFRFKTCLPPSSCDPEMYSVFCPKYSDFSLLNN